MEHAAAELVGARLGRVADLRRAAAGALRARGRRRERDLFDRVDARRRPCAKNPSVVFSVLSWMLTPSSVMLMVLCGRPLTIESRVPPAVVTPGRNTTKSAALRLESGRLAT